MQEGCDACAGSPGGSRLSSLQNRTFDTAPGSPLRRGASSITIGPISRQGTPHKVKCHDTIHTADCSKRRTSSEGVRPLAKVAPPQEVVLMHHWLRHAAQRRSVFCWGIQYHFSYIQG